MTTLALALAACGGAEDAPDPEERADAVVTDPTTYVSCDELLARFGHDRAWLASQVRAEVTTAAALVQVTLTDRQLGKRCLFRNTGPIVNTYPQSPWQSIGSVTKLATSMVLARYISEGRVRATTTVDSLLRAADGWTLPEKCTSATGCTTTTPITLLDLANHAARLPNMPSRPGCWGGPNCGVDEHTYTEAQFKISLSECRTLRCAREVAPTYSNYGYALLGRALQQVRGYGSYLEMVRAEIFLPLDMPAVGIMFTADDPLAGERGACVSAATPGCIPLGAGNTVLPYDANGSPATSLAARLNIPAWSPLAPAGALWMMTTDLARFAGFALGTSTPPELAMVMPTMLASLGRSDTSDLYALGWNIDADSRDLYKGGSVKPGYRTFVLMDLGRTLAVTVTTNVGNGGVADMEGLAYRLRALQP